MKKLISLLLCAALLVGLLPIGAAALDPYEDQYLEYVTWTEADTGFTWSARICRDDLSGDGSGGLYASLTYVVFNFSYDGYDSAAAFAEDPANAFDLVLPSTAPYTPRDDEYNPVGEELQVPVRVLDLCLYNDFFPALRSVTVPASVELICDGLLYDCTATEHLYFAPGSQLKRIAPRLAQGAFSGSGLVAVELPDTVEEIGAGSFSSCKRLESVTLPTGLVTIGNNAFAFCDALRTADLTRCPGLTEIGKMAFDCCALASVTIPDSVRTVGQSAFSGQMYRTDPDDWQSAVACLTELDLGSGVQSIGAYAFENNPNLAGTLYLPDSLTEIGNCAFSETGITDVRWPENDAFTTVCGFTDCDGLTGDVIASLPYSVSVIGGEAFSLCDGITELTIPSHVRVIDDGAFRQCKNLTLLHFLPGVERIGVEAFALCQGLENTTVEVPASLKSLGSGAFSLYDHWFDEEDKLPFTFCALNPDLVLEPSDDRYITGNIYYWYTAEEMEKPSWERQETYGADAFARVNDLTLIGPATNSAGEPSALKAFAEERDGTFVSGGLYPRTVRFLPLETVERHTVTVPKLEDVTVTVRQGGEILPPEDGGTVWTYSAREGQDVAVTARKAGFLDQVLVRFAEDFTADWTVEFGEFAPLPVSGRLTVALTRADEPVGSFDDLTLSLTLDGTEIPFTASFPWLILDDPDGLDPDAELTLTVTPDASLRLGAAAAQTTLRDGAFAIDLIPWGDALITASGSPAAIATLFDEAGNAAASAETAGGLWCTDPLPAGTYTAAAFEVNAFFGAADSLSALETLGLQAGRDYAVGTLTVRDGQTAELALAVPHLDTTALTSALDPSLCAVVIRTGRAIAEQTVSVQVRYALKDKTVTEAEIRFALPDGAVLESVCDETHLLAVDGNAVRVNRPNGTLCLNLRFTRTGRQSVGASLRTGGLTLPLGSASVEVGRLFADLAEPLTSSLNGNAVDVLAAPNAEIRLLVDGVEAASGTANAAGRLRLSYDLPEEAAYGQVFQLRIAAGEAFATETVSYYPQTGQERLGVKSLAFWQGGARYVLIDAEQPDLENRYYTYIVSGKEKDKYFSFRAELYAWEYLENPTLTVLMQDGSTRTVPLTLTEVQGDVGVCVGALYVDNDGDHVFKSSYIPVGFDVNYGWKTLPEPTGEDVESNAFLRAELRAKEREDWLAAAMAEAGYTPMTQEEIKAELVAKLREQANEVGITDAELAALIDEAAEGLNLNLSVLGRGYALSSLPGLSMTAEERAYWLADINADVGLTEEQKAASRKVVNDAYEKDREIVTALHEFEGYCDQICDLLTDYLGLPKKLQDYESAEAVMADVGLTIEDSPSAQELVSEGYEKLGTYTYLKEEADGGLSGAWPSNDRKPADPGALRQQRIKQSARNKAAQQNSKSWAVSSVSDGISLGTAAADVSISAAEAALDYERTAIFFLDPSYKNREACQEFLYKKLAKKEVPVKNARQFQGAASSVGNVLSAVNIHDDGMEWCKNHVRIAEVEGWIENLETIDHYYDTHEIIDPDHIYVNCKTSVKEELKILRRLKELLDAKGDNLGWNIVVGTGGMVIGLATGGTGTVVLSAAQTGYDVVSSAKTYTRDQAIIIVSQSLRKARARRMADCGGSGFRKGKLIDPILDPSGFVYEAVESNKLAGVTATVFDVTNGTAWNADEYDQTNPQITGLDGGYAWDVPMGDWRVDFAKEGYRNASTEVLTVPPPRTELRTAMVSTEAPQVAAFHAYPDYLELVFTQYMDITTELTVPAGYTPFWADPTPVSEGSETAYATVLRLTPETPAQIGDTVSVTLSGAKNYAGTPLAAWSGEGTVERRHAQLVLNYEDQVTVLLGETPIPRLTARVLDPEGNAVPGMTVTAEAESAQIARVTAVSAETDETGLATFEVEGLLPGLTDLTVRVTGTTLETTLPLRVLIEDGRTARPTAVLGETTLSAGAPKENEVTVPYGTELVLACETEGATVWYTLNGMCPCQDTANRFAYTAPVVLTEDAYFRITAYKPGLEYSERLNIRVTVTGVPPQSDPCEGYDDIERESWYHAAADFAIQSGFMGSTSQTELHFEPYTKVSRAMVASILYRICGAPKDVEFKGTFTDVKQGAWYATAVEWCAQNGLASGKGDGRFDPDGLVTRQELAVFMSKLETYLYANDPEWEAIGPADLTAFPDGNTVPAWALDYVKWAVAAGLITGKGQPDGTTLLAPVDTAMRCELASILQRFLTR